jgi:RNA polymerase sigma-70 factor (ECF subfamily)
LRAKAVSGSARPPLEAGLRVRSTAYPGIPALMADEATRAAAHPAKDSTAHVRRLVERGQQGDRGALEELYLLHFDRIYSYLHMSVGNRHDAEDLTTQTFLKMLESIKRFRWQSAPFSAWLFRIAHNLAMDHFRANRRWQPEEEVPEPEGESEPSAEAAALQSIGRQSMLELIDGLSTEQQQVLTLKFVFNLPNADVATILDKSEGAIKSLQHRALVSLQKQVSQTAEP